MQGSFNIRKSIRVTHCINRLKEENKLNTKNDNKIEYPLLILLAIWEEKVILLILSFYWKYKPKITLNGEI